VKKRMIWLRIMVVIFFCTVEGSAVQTYNDGGVHEINTPIAKSVQIYDGPANQPTTVELVAGGSVQDVDVYQNSLFLMSDGTFGDGRLALRDSSRGEISGGIVNDDPFYIWNNSQLIITGSDFSEGLWVYDEGQVYIYGSDFSIDDVPVGYGPVPVTNGLLEGTLWNGQIRSALNIRDNGMVTLVPEPASLSLLLGTLLLTRKRNR